ncbi:carbohydrate-binding protein [Enterobacter sp. RIT418]|uniref:carbohydrate-binding protein n=1 Tax=Enterobacter sp. RIT418 TaxID=2202164 RepID=UPI0011BE470C|nr:carbohydrate-binding protein [Enterobacter sp. RIT 418]
MKLLLMFFVMSLGTAFLSAPALASVFATLQNQAITGGYCLASGSNGILTFKICNGSKEQNWSFSDSSGYFMIRNEMHRDKCLRTLGNGRSVELGTCQGDGYSSMRLWQVKAISPSQISLQNKYNNDLARREMLIADPVSGIINMADVSNEPKMRWEFAGEIPSPKRPVIGNKKVLLMATHFTGKTPADPEPVRKAVFGDNDDFASLQHYVTLASHGKLSIDGTFLKNINIGIAPATCSSGAILDNARNAARAEGVDPNNYDYLFVDISRTASCNWEGLASKPGNWILSNGVGFKYWMWSHEFGHNLGYSHSTTLRNCPINDDIVEINNTCSAGGGDDPTDTMGGGGGKLFPVNYQLFAGWLNDQDVPLIKADGQYKLAPLWQPGGAQGYRIQRSDGSVLILEYRQRRQGFEQWDENSPFVNGVTLRIVNYSGNSLTNTLVDTTPGSSSGMKDAPLMPGKSVYDALSGKVITVLVVDKDGALLNIRNP